MSKFSKEHYEDVARMLFPYTATGPSNEEHYGSRAARLIAVDFADLFAADHPPSTHCWHCGSNRNVVTDCTHVEHNYGGFNREEFLTACGAVNWTETDEQIRQIVAGPGA